MKYVKSFIKLANNRSQPLSKDMQNSLTGGKEFGCVCGCFYADCGGSSTIDNFGWNAGRGLESPEPPAGAEWGGM